MAVKVELTASFLLEVVSVEPLPGNAVELHAGNCHAFKSVSSAWLTSSAPWLLSALPASPRAGGGGERVLAVRGGVVSALRAGWEGWAAR